MTLPAPTLPLTEAETAAFARLQLDLDLPPETLPGVLANLRLLADHIRRLEGQ